VNAPNDCKNDGVDLSRGRLGSTAKVSLRKDLARKANESIA